MELKIAIMQLTGINLYKLPGPNIKHFFQNIAASQLAPPLTLRFKSKPTEIAL